MKFEVKEEEDTRIKIEDFKFKTEFDKLYKEDEKGVLEVQHEDTPPPASVAPKKKVRKQRLKYRPENGTVLDISRYDDEKLLSEQEENIDIDDVSFLNHAFFQSQKMICIAGAGISVGAGIPDFRSSDGFFNSLNNGQGKNLFDYQAVYRDNDTMTKFHEMIHNLYLMSLDLKPTLFHQFMNYLASDNRLMRLYTQNVDGFELQLPFLQTEIPLVPPTQKSKPPPRCIQLHGNVQIMNCTKCHYKAPLDPNVFTKLTANSPAPLCPECQEMDAIRAIAGKRQIGSGTLRPRIVLYNEFHPDGEIIGQISQRDLKAKPDCLVIVGTTLKIPGVRVLARELTRVVHANKGCVIWINKEEPSMSVVDFLEYLDLIIVGDCQDIPKLLIKYACEIDAVQKRKAANAARRRKSAATTTTPKTKLKQSTIIPRSSTTLLHKKHTIKSKKSL